VKSLHAPHLQTLTMPALDMLSERPQETKRRLGLKRRTPDLGVLYDPQMVAAQIIDGLERARLLRLEHEAAIEHARWLAERGGASSDTATAARPDASAASGRSADERRRAPRVARADASWVSGVRMPWGLDLDLINISNSGLLVESSSKLSAGVTYELQLDGPSGTLVVKACFIRSDVGRVDGRGVRYHSAAAFERQLDLAGGRSTAPAPSSQQALADLLAMVIAESDHQPEPADVRFARGLRQLVRARDVLVRRSPIVPADGSESIYFHVTGEDRSRTILQILFDPDRGLTATEFSLLRAAASLTAAVIELDRSRQSALLSAPSMVGVA
jgi:hypothetical protein